MRRAAEFAGTWALRRRIEDRAGGPEGQFAGTAELTGAGADWLYAEWGELRLGAQVFVAERRYLWRFEAAGVEVRFADGRAFHRFVPDGLAPGTDHPCGPDLYRVTYDFRDWPVWTSSWQVRGPRKDYTMVTRYARPA